MWSVNCIHVNISCRKVWVFQWLGELQLCVNRSKQGGLHPNSEAQQALAQNQPMDGQGQKRVSAGDGGPAEKRLKGEPEDTDVYSQRIKKKLQANSRTGQACDRCKVRSQNIMFPSPNFNFH